MRAYAAVNSDSLEVTFGEFGDDWVNDYVTLGRFALIPGLWRKVGLGRGGGGWDGVGHVGGRD